MKPRERENFQASSPFGIKLNAMETEMKGEKNEIAMLGFREMEASFLAMRARSLEELELGFH